MDISRQLKIASTSGKLLFGQRQAIGACARGEAKCVIVAEAAPRLHRRLGSKAP